jgi:hypothetical protein
LSFRIKPAPKDAPKHVSKEATTVPWYDRDPIAESGLLEEMVKIKLEWAEDRRLENEERRRKVDELLHNPSSGSSKTSKSKPTQDIEQSNTTQSSGNQNFTQSTENSNNTLSPGKQNSTQNPEKPNTTRAEWLTRR